MLFEMYLKQHFLGMLLFHESSQMLLLHVYDYTGQNQDET